MLYYSLTSLELTTRLLVRTNPPLPGSSPDTAPVAPHEPSTFFSSVISSYLFHAAPYARNDLGNHLVGFLQGLAQMSVKLFWIHQDWINFFHSSASSHSTLYLNITYSNVFCLVFLLPPFYYKLLEYSWAPKLNLFPTPWQGT